MIKSARLQEFQSHKDTTLQFSAGLNAILGESDKGKTSVLRGIDWAMNNRPGGDAFCRHGSKETTVTVTLDADTTIERAKGKANTYKINGGAPLAGFGQGVPEKVTRLFNMGDINIQRQFDGPFLLNESSGEVARRLNEIADLQIIDTTIANNNRALREAATDIAVCAAKRDETEEAMEELAFLDDLKEDLDKLHVLEARYVSVEGEREDLSDVVEAIQTLLEDNDYEWMEGVGEAIADLQAKEAALDAVATEKALLGQRHSDAVDLNGVIDILSEELKGVPALAQLEKRKTQHTTVTQQIQFLHGDICEYRKNKKALAKWGEVVAQYQAEIDRTMPETCPLCDAPKNWRKR